MEKPLDKNLANVRAELGDPSKTLWQRCCDFVDVAGPLEAELLWTTLQQAVAKKASGAGVRELTLRRHLNWEAAYIEGVLDGWHSSDELRSALTLVLERARDALREAKP